MARPPGFRREEAAIAQRSHELLDYVGIGKYADFKARTLSYGDQRRLEIARGQTPFAVLVSCSDSRVPPEVLFGRGLGELFIVRNAGNTVDTVALGSIEYAIAVLGVPLVVVLGHERCGAVEAALSVVEKNTVFPGSLNQMIEPILPAALIARSSGAKGEELLDAAIIAARQSPNRGRVKVVGARYDLDDGQVEFFMT